MTKKPPFWLPPPIATVVALCSFAAVCLVSREAIVPAILLAVGTAAMGFDFGGELFLRDVAKMRTTKRGGSP